MAGGALSDAGVWIRPKTGFLFPVRALSRYFVASSSRVWRACESAGDGRNRSRRMSTGRAEARAACPRLGGLCQSNLWVAPRRCWTPGRYTHRVAISNERIVGIDGNDVLFRVRADRSTGKKRTIHLPGTEFIGRFLHHVLPPGFKRIRHYGLLSPARKNGLAAARAALECRRHTRSHRVGGQSSCARVGASSRPIARAVSDSFMCRGCSCVSLADQPTFPSPRGHRERVGGAHLSPCRSDGNIVSGVLARSRAVLVRGVGHAEPDARNSPSLALLLCRTRDIFPPTPMQRND
ncbi:transposase [Propionivibrio sp.]|uniref:transposase n=1 Tax=Propionivibrio sp. TaxID=2212460 RepID=UPI00345B548E